MDRSQLNLALYELSWECKLDQLYDVRSKEPEYRAAIKERGLELARQYKEVSSRFRNLCELVGMDEERLGYIESNPICLGKYSGNNLGEGKLVAYVSTPAYTYPSYNSIDTAVYFVPDDDNEEPIELVNEKFSSVGLTMQGGYDFLEDGYDWIRPKDGRRSSNHVASAWNEFGNKIANANETINMLMQAISDPALNPEYASKVAAINQQ